jgi:predicted negative regulator of RcsB-dependent stress response
MNRFDDARAAWEKALDAERGDQILTPLINLKLTALPEKK